MMQSDQARSTSCVRQILELSFRHIRDSTADLIGSNDAPTTNYVGEEAGVMLYVPSDDSQAFIERNEPHKLPDDLKRIIELARTLGCRFVLFDVDGHQRDDLPCFDGEVFVDESPCAPRSVDGFRCRFRPQAWVRDWAMDVDPLGRVDWTVPFSALERVDVRCPHDRDHLRFEGDAPEWIRDWSGPFEVEVLDEDAVDQYLEEREGGTHAA